MAGYVVPAALASTEDLAEWMQDTAPTNAAALLRTATMRVLDATKCAVYDVDADGLATDPDVLAALRDATCIQAAAWAALNIDPATGGVLTRSLRTSTKIGTAAITYDAADTAAAVAARKAALAGLVPDAVARLQQQNLISRRVAGWRYGC